LTKSPTAVDVFNRNDTKTSLNEVSFLINKLREIHYQIFEPPIKIGYFQDMLMQEMKNHVHIFRIQDIEKQCNGCLTLKIPKIGQGVIIIVVDQVYSMHQ
jgi:hypothetical protein